MSRLGQQVRDSNGGRAALLDAADRCRSAVDAAQRMGRPNRGCDRRRPSILDRIHQRRGCRRDARLGNKEPDPVLELVDCRVPPDWVPLDERARFRRSARIQVRQRCACENRKEAAGCVQSAQLTDILHPSAAAADSLRPGQSGSCFEWDRSCLRLGILGLEHRNRRASASVSCRAVPAPAAQELHRCQQEQREPDQERGDREDLRADLLANARPHLPRHRPLAQAA